MMTRRTHIAYLFTALGFLIPLSAVNGQTKAEPALTISPQDQELVHFLLTSMKKSREKMATGECTATMSYFQKVEKWDLVMTESIHCAFDFPAQTYLIKRHRPPVQGKYISTPQKSFLHTSGPVTIHHPMEKPVLSFRPFDIRVLGWTAPHNYDTASYEKRFTALIGRAQWHEVEKEGAGVYKIVFRWGTPQQAEHKLWLDSSKDFLPVRFEYGELEPNTGKWNTQSIVETEWKEHGEGWFPEVVTSTEIHRKGTPQETVTKRVMKFYWKRANKPVDQSLFTLKSWNLPPQTLLLDLRPGEENFINLGPISSNPE